FCVRFHINPHRQSFPTRRSSDLKTIGLREHLTTIEPIDGVSFTPAFREEFNQMVSGFVVILITTDLNLAFKKVISETSLRMKRLDRKSTRLNSSHVSISYAVFCL